MKPVSNTNTTAHHLAALTPARVVNYQHGDSPDAVRWNYGAEIANRVFTAAVGAAPDVEPGIRAISTEIRNYLCSGAHPTIIAALTTARDNVVLRRGPAA